MLNLRKFATKVLLSTMALPNKPPSNSYAAHHAGDFSHNSTKPPKTNETDMSGKHVQVFKTSCTTSNCSAVNCADPSDPNVSCPGRTAVENMTTIPDTPEHTTRVVGNMTSKIPNGMKGGIVDSLKNYAGQTKPQFAIVDSAPAADREVNPADVKVHLPATNLLQKNHSNVSSIFTK